MSSSVPNFATAADRANPLAWSLQGVVPNPVVKGAYPISGFTWLEMYQCYAAHPTTGANPLAWFKTWLDYLYGSQNAHDILHDNGFAEAPYLWTNEIYNLLNDTTYGPNQSGCTGKVGAY
jgi:hypothetical protein